MLTEARKSNVTPRLKSAPAAPLFRPLPPAPGPSVKDRLELSAASRRPALPVLDLRPSRQLWDNEANLKALKAMAQRDGMPSVITSDGGRLSYFKGALPTESAIAHRSADEGISLAQRYAIQGRKHTVLYTDDGFSEIDQKGVVVAVIDSGVDPNARVLAGRLVPGYNTGTHGTDTSDDAEGHGTFVASRIAGADTVDSVAKGVSIMPIKIQDWEDDKFLKQLADGITYAADHGAKIINISVGSNFHASHPDLPWEIQPSDPQVHAADIQAVKDAIAYATRKGALVVAAAGNEGDKLPDTMLFPASESAVLAVGNLDDVQRPRRIAEDSSRGPALDLVAPGTKVFSWTGNGYFYQNGASFAAPYVTGLAALIAARHPDWTPAQIKEQLEKSAKDMGAPGRDDVYGHGAVNAVEAVFGK